MRVLVIDDDHDSAFLLCELMKKLGLESRFCVAPTQSIDVARRWQPNVILLDLAMPNLDGYHLAPLLRAAANRTVPRIVAVSGYALDGPRLAEAQIDAHLLKPPSLAQLKELLPC